MKLDSTNKRVLIIADIHQDVRKASKIIKAEAADEIVCLGDWFDSFFFDSDYDVKQTCKHLLDFFNLKNAHTLWGNHDLHYFYPSEHTICSGYSGDKEVAIDELLGLLKHHLSKKFKWWIQIDDFTCTHAGISETHFHPFFKLDRIGQWLDKEAEVAKIRLDTLQPHWFYGAGKGRSGKLDKGGIVWLDFEREFEPVEGLKQIVGHSFKKNVRPHHLEGSPNPNDWSNICIDCNLNQYLIIHNKKIEVKNYTDL